MGKRISKEEKIRRLQEKIKQIEEGKDKPNRAVFENKYFLVEKLTYGKGEYNEIHYRDYIKLKRFSYGEDIAAKYTLDIDDYDEWERDAIAFAKFMRYVNECETEESNDDLRPADHGHGQDDPTGDAAERHSDMDTVSDADDADPDGGMDRMDGTSGEDEAHP